MTRLNIAIVARAVGASGAAVGAALAFGAPGWAHPHDGDRKIEKVIVLNHKEGSRPGEHRMIRIDGRDVSCDGEKTTVDETTGDKERTKIVLCGPGAKLSSAHRAKRLEELLGKLRSEEHFSAEHKARVESALQEAIARLRSTD